MWRAPWEYVRGALRVPRATLAYPFAPHPAEPGFRGRVVVDTERCVGCGGCATVCPARCVLITDVAFGVRVIRRHLDRCVHCARCVAACVYDALRLSEEYELATPDRHDLLVEQTLFMGACSRCGRCYVPAHPLDAALHDDWRCDEPDVLARWRAGAPAGAAPRPAAVGG